MARRLVLALALALLVLGLDVGTSAAADQAPTLGTPTITATSAVGVQVSVTVDTHNSDTTVQVEYVTAGAYRPGVAFVPGAATTVTLGSTPASEAGPALVTGRVTGLEPRSTYRMRVKSQNAFGETVSADLTVSTPAAPKTSFKAAVSPDTTKLTKLTVSGLVGGETAKVTCKSEAKGCPFSKETLTLAAGRTSLSSLLKGSPLDPGAKVSVQLTADGLRVGTLTLTIRDDQQPKVRRR